MNKLTLSATVLTLALFGCSDTTNDPISGSVSMFENEQILPFFVFKEDGSRLAVKNGELVEKEMNRSTLVLGADESFASLKKKYEERLSSDNAYLESLERPADYVCDNVLLAINSDYDAVVSSSGETLLNDLSFYKGCKSLVETPATLKKNIDLVDNNLSDDARVEEKQYGRFLEGYKGKYGMHVSSFIRVDEDYHDNSDRVIGQPFEAESQVDVYFHLEKPIKIAAITLRYVPIKAKLIAMGSACAQKCAINNGKLKCQKVEKEVGAIINTSSLGLSCKTSVKRTESRADFCAYIKKEIINNVLQSVCQPGIVKETITEFANPLEYGVVSAFAVNVAVGSDKIYLAASTSANLPKNVASKVFDEYIGDVFSGN